MLSIGKINKLKIIKEVDFGYYLDGFEQGEILLPKSEISEKLEIESEIDVFVYFDSKARIIATLSEPKGTVGEFIALNVVEVNNIGAFLDWGLPKDLFVPFSEQRIKMEKGKYYLVYIFLDEESGRIAATSKIEKYLLKDNNFAIGEEVDVIVVRESGIGYFAVINNENLGLIYKTSYERLKVGEKRKGYISKIREDNKLDVSLRKINFERFDEDAEYLFETLQNNNGFLSLNDKSDPNLIYSCLQMSKKSFKKALGSLYKRKLIKIENNGIRIL